MTEGVVLWIGVAIIGVLLILTIRTLVKLRTLSDSIAKLGYVIREDAKKYFDDASHSVVETNAEFKELYEQIIKNGTKKALDEAAVAMERALSKAQSDAGQTVAAARDESANIVKQAKSEAESIKNQALEQSSSTIKWVLEQYVSQKLNVEQHEALIKKMVDQYTQNNRK